MAAATRVWCASCCDLAASPEPVKSRYRWSCSSRYAYSASRSRSREAVSLYCGKRVCIVGEEGGVEVEEGEGAAPAPASASAAVVVVVGEGGGERVVVEVDSREGDAILAVRNTTAAAGKQEQTRWDEGARKDFFGDWLLS